MITEPFATQEEGPSITGCVRSPSSLPAGANMSRKEKRKALKRYKRKEKRKEMAQLVLEEEVARLNNPEELRRIQLDEERENERMVREKMEFEERERLFLEALAAKRRAEEEEEEHRKALEEELKQNQVESGNENDDTDNWEYIEEGPPEIIWQGNEIIVKKKTIKVKKKDLDDQTKKEDPDRPTSNPLPPQSEAFADYKNASGLSAQQLLENVAQQIPNFGTEQDKAHCPFHLKTGACRFGSHCSRVHFYPDKSCTLLIKNMYNGPGLAWEQDEGLEHTDEEVECCYEEFYEDVHTEFLKFGEIINFKVCRNSSFHLRGNVYVHYKSLDSAVLAYHSMSGRYFAGKQVKCEFVGVTRWKVAICGEYMKSKLKTCSRGTICNFIHCFSNPGGDYEWANWDKSPPKYWLEKMAALFGYDDESGYDKQMERDNSGMLRNSSKQSRHDKERYRRSRSSQMDSLHERSHRACYHENDDMCSSRQRGHTSDDRRRLKILDEKMHIENTNSTNYKLNMKAYDADCDSGADWSDRDFHDYHRSSKSMHSETDVVGDLVDRDKRRDRHHDLTRKSSKHQKKVSEILDDLEDSKDTTCDTDVTGTKLEDRDWKRHLTVKRKNSKHTEQVRTSPGDRWDCWSRNHGSDSSGDRPARTKMRYHHQTRNADKHNYSSRAQPEREFVEKPKKHKRKLTSCESLEYDSPGRYNSSSRTCDFGSDADDKVDVRGRWVPDDLV